MTAPVSFSSTSQKPLPVSDQNPYMRANLPQASSSGTGAPAM